MHMPRTQNQLAVFQIDAQQMRDMVARLLIRESIHRSQNEFLLRHDDAVAVQIEAYFRKGVLPAVADVPRREHKNLLHVAVGEVGVH